MSRCLILQFLLIILVLSERVNISALLLAHVAELRVCDLVVPALVQVAEDHIYVSCGQLDLERFQPKDKITLRNVALVSDVKSTECLSQSCMLLVDLRPGELQEGPQVPLDRIVLIII